MNERAVVVHYAELGLKRGNRHQFERRMGDRLRQAMSHVGIEAKVSLKDRRYVIRVPDTATSRRILQLITRVPGVAHAMPAFEVTPELDAIKQAAVVLMEEAPPGTFKLETRRGDKQFPLNSLEISRAVADFVATTTGRQAKVREPDMTLRVHVGQRYAFISAQRVPGPGGLPVGSAGHMLGFLSGGLDSPVALWKMIRRGARVSAVHFHNRTLQGPAVLEKLQDLCGVLAWSAGKMPLLVVPFEASQRAIVGLVPAEYRMLVYRRAMLRIGARLARKERALGFITGDSLGQVASQTLENLRTIQAVADLPVYAPLCGSDKVEIIQRARQIGTYEISNRPHEDCCSFLIADHPATKSDPEHVAELEAGLDWEALVEEAVQGTRTEVIRPDPELLGA